MVGPQRSQNPPTMRLKQGRYGWRSQPCPDDRINQLSMPIAAGAQLNPETPRPPPAMSKTLARAVVTATALISRRMMRHACGGHVRCQWRQGQHQEEIVDGLSCGARLFMRRTIFRTRDKEPASAVWLTHFVRVYRPLIQALLVRRDRRLGRYAQIELALRDHDLAVWSQIDLDGTAAPKALKALHQYRDRDRSGHERTERKPWGLQSALSATPDCRNNAFAGL